MDVVRDVQDFYERYPYPPLIEDLGNYQRSWLESDRRRADYHLFWPHKVYREDYSILIAGCGTSQAAKHAVRWPHAAITAIDFSASSVRHTEQLKRKYHCANLEVHTLPIERVHELGLSFDQIVCTGVLHHLPDPGAGLRALRGVLKPDGAMHLMVYAPYGRTGIYMLQEFCRRVGIQSTDEGIRELKEALRVLPSGHPLEYMLKHVPDFRDDAALADALLNPQDRAYSVPQLFEFVNDAGLVFGRWLRQAPYSVQCGVVAQLPQAGEIARLSLAEQYAAVELFRGTMARHSVILYSSEGPKASSGIGFADESWLRYVPIRMADTMCVEERLPPGVAAVLINRSHTYTDLLLPVRSMEKSLLDAVDGERSLGDIIDGMPSSFDRKVNVGDIRSFFERLWWHDQVVFDASA